jgi:hypothetical protein
MSEPGFTSASADATTTDGSSAVSSSETAPQPEATPEQPKREIPWKAYLDAARENRRTLLDSEWRTNVDYRMQKPFGGVGDSDQTQDRVAVPEDWSRTKQKTAQLAFQVPKIVANGTTPEWQPCEDVVTAAINEVLDKQCEASYMIDECLADVINAAGVMVSAISIESLSKPMAMPEAMPGMPPGAAPPLGGELNRKVYQCIKWDRVSPAQWLWPREFRQSNWKKAPWLAYEVAMPTELVKKKWPQIAKKVSDKRSEQLRLLSANIDNIESQKQTTLDNTIVTIVWYYTAQILPEVSDHPEHISRCVFVDGISDPVEDGPTDWQEYVPEMLPVPPSQDPMTGQPVPGKAGVPAHYRGIRSLPIRVGTLAYVSDVATPPSDSQAARPQVREMIRSRSQMLRQRDHSIPIRWYDVNRLDEEVADKIRLGDWQDMIPTNGPGDRVIGEVARASYPRENFQFQEVISSDLDRAWALSSNQIGANNATTRSAREVQIVESASQTRLYYEKDRVSRYITEGAEVVWGLMQLFFDQTMYVQIVGEQGNKILASFDAAHRAGQFTFGYLENSMDRVDAQTRFNNLMKMFNLMANDPNTNRVELDREIWRTAGFDPKQYMVQKPPEKTPPPPNVSFRFGGADLLNPMAVATMQKGGIVLNPEDIKAAALMIRDAIQAMAGVQPLPPPPGVQGAPGTPPPGGPPEVTPPTTQEPILKRAVDGTHLT